MTPTGPPAPSGGKGMMVMLPDGTMAYGNPVGKGKPSFRAAPY